MDSWELSMFLPGYESLRHASSEPDSHIRFSLPSITAKTESMFHLHSKVVCEQTQVQAGKTRTPSWSSNIQAAVGCSRCASRVGIRMAWPFHRALLFDSRSAPFPRPRG